MRMRWLILPVLCALSIDANAQSRPPAPPSVRVYVMDCGVLNIADPMPLFGLKKEEVAEPQLSNAAYLVVHPRGTLLWDTCFLTDSVIETGTPQTGIARAGKTLKGQLREIGYRPSDISYLALSHYHGDHTGNANDFQSATWLVNRAEHEAMFAEKAPPVTSPATYDALKKSKTVFVAGDHDVFGDGTVVVKATPGHTPGHQVLLVKLAKTGSVMLAGDLYHYPEEVGRDVVPPGEFNKEQTVASRKQVVDFLKATNTQLWIGHDMVRFRSSKKSPQFYE